MSEPKLPPDLSAEEYRAVINGLLTAWDNLNRHETRNEDLATARIVFALTARAHSMATAAAHLWNGGYVTESMPIVRTCFESAIYAAWIQQNGEAGVKAYLYQCARQNNTLLRQFGKAGLPIPDDVRDAVEKAPQLDLDPPKELKAQAKYLEQACNSLTGSARVYLMYRHLSDESHASIGLIRHLVRGRDDSPVAVKRPSSGDGADSVAAYVVAVSLVWAGRALSEVGRHKPNKQVLRRAARQLGIPMILTKTG